MFGHVDSITNDGPVYTPKHTARFFEVPEQVHTRLRSRTPRVANAAPTPSLSQLFPVYAHPRGHAPHKHAPPKRQRNHQSTTLPSPPPLPIRILRLRLVPHQNPSPYHRPVAVMKGKADASSKGEGRLKAAGGAGKRKKAAASGKPKRPPSAFFVFMSEFRQEYQAQNPNNKSVANVSKAAGEKWRSMSEEEKAPYQEKAGQKKQDYEKSKANFDKESTSSKKAKTQDEEGTKSEVDDDEGGSDEDNEEDE
ncbi:hypothetical protein QOZ80_2AG0140450 [Eleusine coracana subsp. coracana]|nr:hypothetical protein QOZ80_2AG0140450 [Eleusine coracana subsp. coracana]